MRQDRFLTARDVFEAFPTAGEDIEAAPSDAAPRDFLVGLIDSKTPEDAISFCAYLLPRREAVWWGCSCVRGLADERERQQIEQNRAFQAAELWVKDPQQSRRIEALRIGFASQRADASTWLALGAAWSGGDMADNPHAPVMAPPHLTAKAIRAAVLIALARNATQERRARLTTCIDHGLKLLQRRPS
ncbi:DUF6931 family protein [Bosea psychrotolerans]|uniref:Uncharacterized protein n=1 Tax=Bosea psychrotolerans TaxID=1871628 RepID=A0A2S4M9M3_9HYPH|nr:hypothetical protein [Bosea psychrotolerans]POR51438.1 hypothetical protein CYD53_107221 [Bosea psychrotolerans]